MLNINEKLEVLTLIADKFNEENITWAIGGSILLYFKGMTKDFNDIDIEVKEDEIDKVKQILLKLGKLEKRKTNSDFKTKYFYEFKIQNVDVDIMAGLTIVANDKNHYFPLINNNNLETIVLNNQKTPLQSVQKWKKYYKLMGRLERVKLIEKNK